jgi:hypothetical protein
MNRCLFSQIAGFVSGTRLKASEVDAVAVASDCDGGCGMCWPPR